MAEVYEVVKILHEINFFEEVRNICGIFFVVNMV